KQFKRNAIKSRMKHSIYFLLLITTLLTACSAGQAAHPEVPVRQEVQVQPTATAEDAQSPVTGATDLPATLVPSPTVPPTPKPPLARDAWKEMPVVPEEISDAMRLVYQRGLEMGNDPSRFAIIGDCQNVSSYFLAVFDHPGEYSLGEEYAYLQPTIDYYRGSFSRQSLAVKGGFNVAAVLSPLRADPKSCNTNESPLDCELRTWNPSVVF